MSSGLAERDGFVERSSCIRYLWSRYLSREEFKMSRECCGNHRLEDVDFIVGETRSLFDKVGWTSIE